MMRSIRIAAFAAVALGALAQQTSGLEVYRFGGSNLPKPTDNDINFHQLGWSDLVESRSLDEDSLAVGILRPIQLTDSLNIALSAEARNAGPYVRVSGVASYAITDAALNMVDTDRSTYWEWAEGVRTETINSRRITLDLGGLFFINRVRFIVAEENRYPDELFVNLDLGVQKLDNVTGYGAAQVQGREVAEVIENTADTIDVSFPAGLARSVGLLMVRKNRPAAIRVGEVEVYGKGFTDNASFTSSFIDLGEPAVWGDIRWGGSQDPGADVFIQTRAGNTLDPNIYWRFTGRGEEQSRFNENGQPLTFSAYRLLKPGEAGDITRDTENWSFWSAPYDFADSSGTDILSPSPHSVFQVKVDFLPDGDNGGELEFLEFSATVPPLAAEAVAEVWPQDVPLGEVSSFTYLIRPTILGENSGFDQIEVETPFGVVSVDSVKATGLSDYPGGETTVEIGPDSTSFSVQLSPPRGVGDSGSVIEVFYQAPVLRYGTAFRGWVRDTTRPAELPQPLNQGNAADEVLSEALTVRTFLSNKLLAKLDVDPPIFSPNGDGRNDEVTFSFDLLQVTEAVPLQVEMFDVSGCRVAVVHDREEKSGEMAFRWNGRNLSEELVPPGIYVYRVSVEAESGDDQHVGTIGVVY